MAHQFERMEWLGDALLDLIVAEELYKRFPRDDEGSLSLRKQLIVRNDVLSIASRRLDLPTLLLHSRERIATLDAERQRSMAERSKMDRSVNTEKRNGANKWQADVFEALVCALYLANTDRTAERSGFEAAAKFVKKELLDAVVEHGEHQREPCREHQREQHREQHEHLRRRRPVARAAARARARRLGVCRLGGEVTYRAFTHA